MLIADLVVIKIFYALKFGNDATTEQTSAARRKEIFERVVKFVD